MLIIVPGVDFRFLIPLLTPYFVYLSNLEISIQALTMIFAKVDKFSEISDGRISIGQTRAASDLEWADFCTASTCLRLQLPPDVP